MEEATFTTSIEDITKIENREERLNAFRDFMLQHKPDLTIYRVPEKALEAFKELAKTEFCNDYGMALKWLMDNAASFSVILTFLNEIDSRVAKLENPTAPEFREIKTLSGKLIRVKKR